MASIVLKTVFEILAAALLIYGFMHERELIKFEDYLKMVIVVNYRRYKRRKRLEQIRKNRDFRLVSSKGKTVTPVKDYYVA
ncbi:MAG: hypothetical protein IJL63_09210 [Clostridia bacterium]|nr:hypothetical protein [Clostridia bacterium]